LIRFKKVEIITKKRIDWIGGLLIEWCNLRGIYFVFFPPLKDKKNPAYKTIHLQSAASLPCKPKCAKELFFADALMQICTFVIIIIKNICNL